MTVGINKLLTRRKERALMEDNAKKKRWRLNLFDIIFIACALIVAAVILIYSNGSISGIIKRSTIEDVTYTIELQGMLGDTAYYIKPGDELVDRVEKRPLGKVVSVTHKQSTTTSFNNITGEREIKDVLERLDAVIVMTAEATVTESKISIGGFDVRIGTWVSVNGPLYSGVGFIIDMERIGEA